MSLLVPRDIAELVDDARHCDGYDHAVIEQLTLVVGYAHMIQLQPEYLQSLHKHLQALIDLAWGHGQITLFEHVSKIFEIVQGMV